MSIWEKIENVHGSLIVAGITAAAGAVVALLRRIFTDSKRIDMLEQAQRNREQHFENLHKDVREIREAIIKKD